MVNKELNSLVITLNSSNCLGFKYPIGNKELTEKTRKLESEGKIYYSPIDQKWFIRKNNLKLR